MNTIMNCEAFLLGGAMIWLKAFIFNLAALVLAMAVGFLAISIVVYGYELQPGAMRIAPFFRGFIVTIIVAMIAPRTTFKTKFLVFSGIYLLDLLLSIGAAAIAVQIVQGYFMGDPEAAKPWTYGGAVIPFVTGIAGYSALRHYRLVRLPQT
jgi:hypothetical protein